jgi:hypothetical protein
MAPGTGTVSTTLDFSSGDDTRGWNHLESRAAVARVSADPPLSSMSSARRRQDRLLFNERIYHVDPACHRESAREAECQLSTPSTTVN